MAMELSDREYLLRLYDRVWSMVSEALEFVREPTKPAFGVVDWEDFIAEAFPRNDGARIRVSTAFVRTLEQQCDPFVGSLLTADASNGASETEVRGCLLELAVSFVVLHEICHVLCGHVAVLVPGDGRTTTSDALRERRHFYFREVEADWAAVDCLTLACTLPALASYLSIAEDVSLDELTDRARVDGYRILFAAVALATLQVETLRSNSEHPDTRHPMPEARFLAVTHSMMKTYAGIDRSKLSEEQAEYARDYLLKVSRPVVAHLLENAANGYIVRLLKSLLEDIVGVVAPSAAPKGPGGAELVAIYEDSWELRKALQGKRLLVDGNDAPGVEV